MEFFRSVFVWIGWTFKLNLLRNRARQMSVTVGWPPPPKLWVSNLSAHGQLNISLLPPSTHCSVLLYYAILIALCASQTRCSCVPLFYPYFLVQAVCSLSIKWERTNKIRIVCTPSAKSKPFICCCTVYSNFLLHLPAERTNQYLTQGSFLLCYLSKANPPQHTHRTGEIIFTRTSPQFLHPTQRKVSFSIKSFGTSQIWSSPPKINPSHPFLYTHDELLFTRPHEGKTTKLFNRSPPVCHANKQKQRKQTRE